MDWSLNIGDEEKAKRVTLIKRARKLLSQGDFLDFMDKMNEDRPDYEKLEQELTEKSAGAWQVK